MLHRLMRLFGRAKMAPLQKKLDEINALEPSISSLTEDELTAEMTKSKGQGNVAMAFALVREVGRRTLGLRAYDAQVLSALAMQEAAIVELPTGEGKTLVAAFVAVYQSWQGQPVHISTANAYLARRDAQRMLAIYARMGLSVGVVVQDRDLSRKQAAYACDVVYGVHGIFAQDYLQDHLVYYPEKKMQRGLGVAIVDEADSVLLDEARTPVTLSMPLASDEAQYFAFDELARALSRAENATSEGDFWLDHESRTAVLTSAGYETVNKWLYDHNYLSSLAEDSLYTQSHQQLLHKVGLSLAATHLMHKGQDYLVMGPEIVLIDEVTGRLAVGRKWDSGLQQALEAKEGLKLSPESRLISSISVQHYFKRYAFLCGMTGTASQEADEFWEVYQLRVAKMAPHTRSIRIDEPDQVYRTKALKYAAIVAEVKKCYSAGRPVLVGTGHVDQSQEISQLLLECGVPHELLNAQQHDREAYVLAAAGIKGAVTVATNMAGRGVDVQLGGHLALSMQSRIDALGEQVWSDLDPLEKKKIEAFEKARLALAKEEVAGLGGLRILGCERFESRRLDAQLMGRAGRQGDPGSTCFFISLEDALITKFVGNSLRQLLDGLNVGEGSREEARIVKKSVDDAQRQIEGLAHAIRKQVLQYDTVLDEQRASFYALRQQYLDAPSLAHTASALCAAQVDAWLLAAEQPWAADGDWDGEYLAQELHSVGVEVRAQVIQEFEERPLLKDFLVAELIRRKDTSLAQVPADERASVERFLLLNTLDEGWVDHLESLALLRQGIQLRATIKEDPQQAYRRDARELFSTLLARCREQAVKKWLTWAPVFAELTTPD